MIRDLSGDVDGAAKGEGVHVDAAHHIPMPREGAPRTATPPDAPAYFLFPPTYRTPARCSPLRAGEARDVGKFGFIGQIADIAAILPLTHALIVMPSTPAVPDPLRIPDKERAHTLGTAEGNHSSGALVPQISDLTALTGAGFAPSRLQPAIAA